MSDVFNFGGGGATSKVVNTPAPIQGDLNNLLGSQIQGTVNANGGVPAFATPQPQLFNLSAPEEDIRQRLLQFSTDPQALTQNAQGLLSGPLSSYFNLSPGEETARQTGINYASQAPGFDYGQYQQALGGLNQQAQTFGDPTAQLNAANQAWQTFVQPTIQNSLTASGQGRSGAMAETLGRSQTEALLPILQQAEQNRLSALGQQYQGLFSTPGAGATSDTLGFNRLNQLQSMEAQPRNLQTQGFTSAGLPLAQQGIQDLQQGMQYAGLPRQSTLDDYNRLQALTLGVVGRTPFSPGSTSSQNITQRKNLFTDILMPSLGSGLYQYGLGGYRQGAG